MTYTPAIEDLVTRETEEHITRDHARRDGCDENGSISPKGTYCELAPYHDGDHAAFVCRRCWSDPADEPETWTPEEGHDDE